MTGGGDTVDIRVPRTQRLSMIVPFAMLLGRRFISTICQMCRSTLEALFVTSPHAHARIISIDGARALAMAGVHAVLTAEDIPGHNDIAPVFSDEPVLASGTAEYVGHPVALVVAETYDMAFAAAKAVRVAYEPLEPVLSIQEALANKHYTFPEQVMERGDPDGAIEGAVNRVSGRVSCGGQDHFYLEGQVALALPGKIMTCLSTPRPSILAKSSMVLHMFLASQATRSR